MVYTDAIMISDSTIINAIAVDAAGNSSEVAEARYVMLHNWDGLYTDLEHYAMKLQQDLTSEEKSQVRELNEMFRTDSILRQAITKIVWERVDLTDGPVEPNAAVDVTAALVQLAGEILTVEDVPALQARVMNYYLPIFDQHGVNPAEAVQFAADFYSNLKSLVQVDELSSIVFEEAFIKSLGEDENFYGLDRNDVSGLIAGLKDWVYDSSQDSEIKTEILTSWAVVKRAIYDYMSGEDTTPPHGVEFSKPGATYTGSVTVELSTEPGAAIYYTLDGSEPTMESLVYSHPIIIERNTLLRAIAVDAAGNVSRVMQEKYTIMADWNGLYQDLVEFAEMLKSDLSSEEKQQIRDLNDIFRNDTALREELIQIVRDKVDLSDGPIRADDQVNLTAELLLLAGQIMTIQDVVDLQTTIIDKYVPMLEAHNLNATDALYFLTDFVKNVKNQGTFDAQSFEAAFSATLGTADSFYGLDRNDLNQLINGLQQWLYDDSEQMELKDKIESSLKVLKRAITGYIEPEEQPLDPLHGLDGTIGTAPATGEVQQPEADQEGAPQDQTPTEEGTETPAEGEVLPEPVDEGTEAPAEGEVEPEPTEEGTETPAEGEVLPEPVEEGTEVPTEGESQPETTGEPLQEPIQSEEQLDPSLIAVPEDDADSEEVLVISEEEVVE
ncbi:hypothetical protein EIZ39_20110 [Ammoniphilus sp. CFH 90114]|nr:hypothetical protein EIZ39_20110 [Ammoniphilus sp. CFH 90114]